MQIIKWKSLEGLDAGFNNGLFPQPSRLGFDLAVDLYEEKGNVVAKMSLPAVEARNLDIEIDGDVLTISGMREEEKETDEKDYYSKEIRRGSFSRSLGIPKTIDAKKATAGYSDGVLTIAMPIVKGRKEDAIKVRVKE